MRPVRPVVFLWTLSMVAFGKPSTLTIEKRVESWLQNPIELAIEIEKGSLSLSENESQQAIAVLRRHTESTDPQRSVAELQLVRLGDSQTIAIMAQRIKEAKGESFSASSLLREARQPLAIPVLARLLDEVEVMRQESGGRISINDSPAIGVAILMMEHLYLCPGFRHEVSNNALSARRLADCRDPIHCVREWWNVNKIYFEKNDLASVNPLNLALITEQQESLERAIQAEKMCAMKEAADQHRIDLIPLLEEVARKPRAADEPVRLLAVKALAKLGVKEYLDQIIGELTNSANTAVYRKQDENCHNRTMSEYFTKNRALAKLAYINNPATVKVIGPYLYDLNKYPHSGCVIISPLAYSAADALSQMDLLDAPHAPSEQLKVWQKWWEQHKNYYQDLEFNNSSTQNSSPQTEPKAGR